MQSFGKKKHEIFTSLSKQKKISLGQKYVTNVNIIADSSRNKLFPIQLSEIINCTLTSHHQQKMKSVSKDNTKTKKKLEYTIQKPQLYTEIKKNKK